MSLFKKGESENSGAGIATEQVAVATLADADKAISKIDAILDASESAGEGEATLTEDELKFEIRDLEKRIGKKQEHINKLNTELATMTEELKGLKTQRIELLRRELEA